MGHCLVCLKQHADLTGLVCRNVLFHARYGRMGQYLVCLKQHADLTVLVCRNVPIHARYG